MSFAKELSCFVDKDRRNDAFLKSLDSYANRMLDKKKVLHVFKHVNYVLE